MSSFKQYKLAEKSAARQQQVIAELDALVKDIERCEKTILDLKGELEVVNQKHQGRKTTRQDIAYLEDLLKCAHKKLTWEKHIASLKKRTPAILETMSALINDAQAPPNDEIRTGMLRALQRVQAAMERLENVKVD
jgi:predicted RND superfamily exporter protein